MTPIEKEQLAAFQNIINAARDLSINLSKSARLITRATENLEVELEALREKFGVPKPKPEGDEK